MASTTHGRGRGRPRSDRARQAILEASLELLELHGFRALTTQAIAERAGASTGTVYRWWPNKAAIVMDAFVELNTPRIGFSETGDVRDRLRGQMRQLIASFQDRPGEILAALIGEAQFDPELATALRERWLLPRRAVARQVIEEAVARGELSPVEPDLLMDTLYGHIYYRLLLGTPPLDPDSADEVCALVLDHQNRGSDPSV